MNIKKELKEVEDILFENDINIFHAFISGRPVPYTRVIGRKAFSLSDREKKYFKYINHLWSEVRQECLLRGLTASQKEARIEDSKLYLFVKAFVYGGNKGDTDNYGKAVADALQDRKGETRLFPNDKAVEIAIARRVSVDSRDKEGLGFILLWKKKEKGAKKRLKNKRIPAH